MKPFDRDRNTARDPDARWLGWTFFGVPIDVNDDNKARRSPDDDSDSDQGEE